MKPMPRFKVVTIGRNHYVVHVISREFDPAVAFTSKRKALQACDEKNERRVA